VPAVPARCSWWGPCTDWPLVLAPLLTTTFAEAIRHTQGREGGCRRELRHRPIKPRPPATLSMFVLLVLAQTYTLRHVA
jgi:hypothetical protein